VNSTNKPFSSSDIDTVIGTISIPSDPIFSPFFVADGIDFATIDVNFIELFLNPDGIDFDTPYRICQY
jgi:hypothetical protein